MHNIKEIELKIENGGIDLNYGDLQFLIAKINNAQKALTRIIMVSNTSGCNETALKQTLLTIKDIALEGQA